MFEIKTPSRLDVRLIEQGGDRRREFPLRPKWLAEFHRRVEAAQTTRFVRLLVVEVLKELGYYPLEAVDGASALRILGSSQRIDLLITDLGLPDINGRAIADEALTRRKNLPVLFMTGYAAQAAGDAFLADGMEIITKPFTMEVLAARVRDIIATMPTRTGGRTRSAGSKIL